jgi:predicted transposase YbfD/YdcC
MSHPELIMVEHFQGITDYRENHNKKHLLIDIIVMGICCVICGANGFVEIKTIADGKADWFRTFLTLPHGIPSHDTFNRVFARINPQELQACFRSWVAAQFPQLTPGHIAVDGKELSHSQDVANDFANLRLISAWSVTHGIVLGQEVVADDSNEITAVPALLKVIDITNCHFTADAFHCQVNLTEMLTKKQSGFTISVKANQKSLYESVQAILITQKETSSHQLQTYMTTEKDHGRIDIRKYSFTTDTHHLTDDTPWHCVQGVGMVESERWIGKVCERETRYYIHRGEPTVRAFANYVRGHWSIENQLHWRLDVIFNEDGAHVRVNHAPENLAVIRHIAVNFLVNERTLKVGTQAKRLRAASDNVYLEKVIRTPFSKVTSS